MQIPREVFANIIEQAIKTLDADDVIHSALTDLQRDATRVAFGNYVVDGVGCPLTQAGVFSGNFDIGQLSVPKGPMHSHFRGGFMNSYDRAMLDYALVSGQGFSVTGGTLVEVVA